MGDLIEMKVLKTLRVGEELPERSTSNYSLYFPYDYQAGADLRDYLSRNRKRIKRMHVPPEYNIRNFETTVDFLRFLNSNIKMAGFESDLGIDAHTGFKITLEDVKERLGLLNKYLEGQERPGLYVSVENIKKSALSSKEDILELARYVHDKGLGKVKITIDVKDLQKVERGDENTLFELLERLKSEGTLGVVSSIHASSKYRRILKKKLSYVPDDFQLVAENNHHKKTERSS